MQFISEALVVDFDTVVATLIVVDAAVDGTLVVACVVVIVVAVVVAVAVVSLLSLQPSS